MNARPLLALAIGLAAIVAPAVAQTYPDKPVRLLVGFAAGGSADLSARAIADGMAASLGKPVVVENRPGAGSLVAATAVARSDPDGYTLMYGGISMSIQLAIDSSANFDPLGELATAGLVAEAPNVLVINAQLPVKSVKELVAYLKANRTSFASVGVGTSLHLLGEMLKDVAKVDVVHVPYKGSGPALNDLMGGRIDMMFDNLITSLPLIRSGKIRALAVTAPRRASQLPDVPTMGEAGFDGFETSVWFGVFAPRKTPLAVVERVSAALSASQADPKVSARFGTLAMDMLKSDSPEAADAFFRRDIQHWKSTVTRVGLKVEKN